MADLWMCGIGLNNWLINAFNGEWLKTEDPVPIRDRGTDQGRKRFTRELERENLLLLPD